MNVKMIMENESLSFDEKHASIMNLVKRTAKRYEFRKSLVNSLNFARRGFVERRTKFSGPRLRGERRSTFLESLTASEIGN